MALASIIYGGRYEIAAGVGIVFFAGGYLIGKSLVAPPNDNLWYLLTGFTADGKAIGDQGNNKDGKKPGSSASGPVPPPKDPYAQDEGGISLGDDSGDGSGDSGDQDQPLTATELARYKAILNGPQPGFTPRSGTVDPAQLLSSRLNYETVALYVYHNNSLFSPEELQRATKWIHDQNTTPTSEQILGFDTNAGNHWAAFNVVNDTTTINKAYPPDNDTFTNTHGFNDATDRILANPNYYSLEAVHRAQLWDFFRKGGKHPGRNAYLVTDNSPEKRELTVAYQQQQNRSAEASGRPLPYPNAGTGTAVQSGSSGTTATTRPGTGPATTAPAVTTPLPPGGGGSSVAQAASTSTVPSADPAAQAAPKTPPSQTTSQTAASAAGLRPPSGGRGSATATTGTPRPQAPQPAPPRPPAAAPPKTPQQLAGLRVPLNRSRRL